MSRRNWRLSYGGLYGYWWDGRTYRLFLRKLGIASRPSLYRGDLPK